MFDKIEGQNILQEIFAQIQKNVQNGNLKKGDRLPPERQMASDIGVSRTSLREVLRALQLIGLIDGTQGMGNVITNSLAERFAEPLSIMFILEGGTVEHIHQFRQAIEISAVENAAPRIRDSEIDELYALCSRIEHEADKGENHLSELDNMFHRQIAQISGNPLIITMIGATENLIRKHISVARAKILRVPANQSKINTQHRALVDAFAEHDTKKAVATIASHMQMIAEHYFY